MAEEPEVVGQDPSTYCRDVESYLCRKNEGHLIRIVGPAFEQVCGWAERGVPLKIAFRGIDRYCDRQQTKGRRRRPVRIECCEADILDAFDEWRRAVGVVMAGGAADEETAGPGRKPALAAHIDRALAKLRSLGESKTRTTDFRDRLAAASTRLETLAADARVARGENRARIIEELVALDLGLVAAARNEIDGARAAELQREAETELAPFGARMAADARERALRAAFERLTRETIGLPVLAYE